MNQALAAVGHQVGWASHHALSAAVHSDARARSNSAMHSRITAQYTIPVVTGPTSPPTTDTITSSSRAMPAAVSPMAISAWPCPSTPKAHRSASPNRAPISPMRTASSQAAASLAGTERGEEGGNEAVAES